MAKNAITFDSSAMMGAASKFSDSLETHHPELLVGENTAQTQKHVQQDMNIFWKTLIDYSREHPEFLNGYVSEFFQRSTSEIFGIFPIVISNKAHFYQNEIRMRPVMAPISTRKTPPRIINIETKTRFGSAVYTGQGFSMDLGFMGTPDGRVAFDRMLSAVISDLWCMIIFSALKEMQAVPSNYCTPEQLYAFGAVPTTVKGVFDYERTLFGALNKDHLAVHKIVSRVNKIFEQSKNGSVGKIIATRDCVQFATVKDEANVLYDQAGQAALTNRAASNTTRSLHGVPVVEIPLLAPELHGDMNDNVLRNIVVTGSMTSFPELFNNSDPSTYKTTNRDIMQSSWTADKLEVWPFLKFISACPEFVPMDSTSDLAGFLNIDLLNTLAQPAKMKELMNATRLKASETNKHGAHQFLNYHGNDVWKPIIYWADIHEMHLKKRHLAFVMKTIHCAFERLLTPEDIEKLQIWQARARASAARPVDAEYDTLVEKFTRAAVSIFRDNSLLNKANFADTVNSVKAELFNDNTYQYTSSTTSKVDVSGTKYTMYSSGNRKLDDKAQVLYRNATIDATPSDESFMTFAINKLFKHQLISLRCIEGWAENDIAIPLGGYNFRPFETQFMESMSFVANGEVGKTYMSDMRKLVGFDQAAQQFDIGVDCQFKTMITNTMNFYVFPFTRGLQILGGKGNRYINESDDRPGEIAQWNTPKWKELMRVFGDGEQMGAFSVIPVLTSYTAAIEDGFEERHRDLRGHWKEEDFYSRMHISTDFAANLRETPMYDNQLLTNLLYPEMLKSPVRSYAANKRESSFNDIADARMQNYHVHQTTQLVLDPRTLDWTEIKSSHMWGDERDNIVGVQNSTYRVSVLRNPK